MFGSWFDHVKGWLNAEEKESILFIFYEEMIAVSRSEYAASLYDFIFIKPVTDPVILR